MQRTSLQIIQDIEQFVPIDGSWLRLEDLLSELFQRTVGREGIVAMLGVLERFPTEDGAGVFWSIVHGLESLPGYEPYLIESVRRRPSDLGLVMLHRILNSGQSDAGGISIRSVLLEVVTNPEAETSVREQAESFLRRATG